MKFGQLARSQFCALRAVCAGVPFCLKMTGGQQAIAVFENTLK